MSFIAGPIGGSGGGGGITSLNGLSGSTQTFSIGTSGNSPSWSSSGTAHELNIPLASVSGVTAGLISKATYDAIGFAFGIVQCDAGSSPTAETATDTLTLTSTELDITGTAGTDTVTFGIKNAAVIGKVLTGFSASAGTVASTDTILQAFNKLAGNGATYVVGPASATTATIPLYSGTSGKLLTTSILFANGNGIASTGASLSIGINSNPTTHLTLNASGGNNFINALCSLLDGSGNTYYLGAGTGAGVYPFARGYFGTGGVVIGTGVTTLFTPNYDLNLRATTARALYQQWCNSNTGTASTDGVKAGIDATGNYELNQQENLVIDVKTSGTTRFTVRGNGIINFAAAAIPSYADDAAAGAGGLVTGDLYRIGQTLTVKS